MSNDTWSDLCAFLQESYFGVDSIRTYASVPRFLDDFHRFLTASNESLLGERVVNNWAQICIDIVTEAVIFVCMFVGILLVKNGTITLEIMAMMITSGFMVGVFSLPKVSLN